MAEYEAYHRFTLLCDFSILHRLNGLHKKKTNNINNINMNSFGKTIFVAIALVSLLFVSCTDNPDLVYKINFMSCDQEDTDKSGFIDEKGHFCDLSVEVDDCTPVINGIHECLGNDQGLIEVENGTTKSGLLYIQSIVSN